MLTNYPRQLDTDTQLFRVVPSTPNTVDIHNSHTDALENVELTLGPIDDGTAGGGTQAFTTLLSDVVNFQSTAQVNPRYPVVPPPANAWHGFTRVTPAAWTLGSGVAVDYTTNIPLARLHGWGTPPALIASAAVIGSVPWACFVRSRPGGLYGENTARTGIGFSVSGAGNDLDGVTVFSVTPGTIQMHPVHGGTEDVADTIAGDPVHLAVCIVVDAANVSWYATIDGAVWYLYKTTFARSGAPTKLVIIQRLDESIKRPFFLDYISQGNAAPANVGH